MTHDLTHASFFSGVGGLDMGLERAGWRTVSFSEIDPYASAVLAQRWPAVPNLGDITALADRWRLGQQREPAGDIGPAGASDDQQFVGWDAASRAALWTGGFPCQDLSVAGKRRGMGRHDERMDSRSGLAYAFLDLVERYRPPAVLLENVPGLLSSHGGRDMAALLGRLVELGYGVGYRVLDARYFGVPQRRRRVFILGVTPGGRAGAERAAEVLSVGSRCRRHPPTGVEAGEGAAAGAGAGTVADSGSGDMPQGWNTNLVANAISASAGHHGHGSPRGDGSDNLVARSAAADGLAATVTGTYGTKWNGNAGATSGGNFALAGPPDDARGQGRRRQGAADLGGHEPDDGHQPDPDAVRRAERAAADPGRMRAPDGLAGRAHDRGGVAATLNSGGNNGGFRTEPGEHLVAVSENQRGEVLLTEVAHQLTTGGGKPGQGYSAVFVKAGRAQTSEDAESWREGDVMPTLNAFDVGDVRTTAAIIGGQAADDPLLPLGLDSHRYRCCGNGVVSSVAEWIGQRLAEEFA